MIFSLVSFNRQDQGREDEEGEKTMDMELTKPVGAGIKMSTASPDDKTEEFMKDFGAGRREDDDDDQTDAIFKVVNFGPPGNGNVTLGNTTIMEKSMDMTQLHGGKIIDYRDEGKDSEERADESEADMDEVNDETMDFTTIVDRAHSTDKQDSPSSVKVFVEEEEREDADEGSADEKTDMVFGMVSFGNKSLEGGAEEEEDAQQGEGEGQEESISRMSLPSFNDSVLNGDDDDRTDTVFNVVSFAQGAQEVEEDEGTASMVMGTEFVAPIGTPAKNKETLKIIAPTPKRTPGRTPRRAAGTPGRITGTPGRITGTPGKPAGTPMRTPARTPLRPTPKRTPAGTPRKTPRRTPAGTPRRTPRRTPSSLSKEITSDTDIADLPADFNPFAKRSNLVQNSPIVGNSSFHNNSLHNNSLHNPPVIAAGQTDTEVEGEEATNTLFSLVSQPQGEKGGFEEPAEQPSPIQQQDDTSFANKSTARGVLLFGEDKANDSAIGSPAVSSPFAHRAINDSDYDPFASSPLLSQTAQESPRPGVVTTPLSATHLRNQHGEEDSPNTSTYSSGRFSLENNSFALTEQDLVFSADSPSHPNKSLLDWDPSSPAPASPAPASPAPASPAPASPAPASPAPASPAPASPAPASPAPTPAFPTIKITTQSPTPSAVPPPSTPISAPLTPSNLSLTSTPMSRRESNPFSDEVEHSLRKLRICSKRLSDKISIHSTPITPRTRAPVRNSLGGDSARGPMPACEFMRSLGIGQEASSNTSFSTSRTPQRLALMTPGGKRRKSNPNSRLTPRTMTRLTSKAGNWVNLMLDDSTQKDVPYQLVAAFAEGPHFDSLEKQLSDTRKQTNDLQRRLQMLEQEMSTKNPKIFQEYSKATGVKKSIMSDRLSRCYQKCYSEAKLEWLKQSAASKSQLQEELNNHKQMIQGDLATYQKHIEEFDTLQSAPRPAPAPSSTRDPSSLAENSMIPDDSESHTTSSHLSENDNGGYSDPKKIEMFGKDMYQITASLQPWTLSSVTASQLQFQFSSFCHVRVNFGGVLEDGGRVVTRTSIMMAQEKASAYPEQMEWVKALVENSAAYRKWATLKSTKSLPALLTLFSTTVRRATLLVKEIDSLRLLHHQPYILEISPNNQHQLTTLPLLTKVTFLRKNEPYFSVLFALSSEYPFAPLHHCVLNLSSSSPLKSHVEDMIVSVSHAESGVCYPLSCIVNALAQFVGSQ